MTRKGTFYQSKARALLCKQGAVRVLTTGGTGYAGGVDLIAFYPWNRSGPRGEPRSPAVAIQVKACHSDRGGRRGAGNAAMRAGVKEIAAETLPAWVEREVWLFRRGELETRTVENGKANPP